MRKLIIMRGLPGSGKSTWIANNLKGKDAVICSADSFFMRDGHYNFKPWLIGKAHEKCKARAFTAMSRGTDTVVIDNTNTQHWEYELYELFAYAMNYKVAIVNMHKGQAPPQCMWQTYEDRNIHGVPYDAIAKMAQRWER